MTSPFARPLESWIEDLAAHGSAGHARRVARALYRGEADEGWRVPDIPRPMIRELEARDARRALPPVRRTSASADGTEKLLLDLADGRSVETVLIPQARSAASRARMQERLAPERLAALARRPPRASGCVSTQVGCGVGCAFCASGLEGLARNLRPDEIVGQVLRLRDRAEERGYHLGSLVVMGMGEPFHNTENLLVALRNLTARWGGERGANTITVSTVGVAEGIDRLAAEGPATRLTLSLHAPDDPTREEIVRIAPKLPRVTELCDAVAAYGRTTKRLVTISYVLLAGVNDTPAQARDLARLVATREGLDHVNLIPWNAVAGLPFAASPPERVAAFFDVLRDAGVPTHVRTPRGAEADMACGQLRLADAGAPRQT